MDKVREVLSKALVFETIIPNHIIFNKDPNAMVDYICQAKIEYALSALAKIVESKKKDKNEAEIYWNSNEDIIHGWNCAINKIAKLFKGER